jgi:type IV secretory pathway VirB4 component
MRSPRRRLKRRSRRSSASGTGQFDQEPSGKGLFGLGKSNGAANTPIDGFPAPEALEITPRAVKAGDTWFRTLAIVGWPREVSAGWLQPLLSWRGAADIALYFDPVANDTAARHLQKQRARFSSSLSKTGISDPQTEVAASDADDIARSIARGESRLFRLGLYITLRADTLQALDAETYKVKVLCSSLLLDARPTTYRALEGWLTTLPLGADQIKLRRTFDTRAGADCFPFATGEMVGHPSGILFGRGVSRTRTDATGGSPIFVDRFALPNHNMLILASSGAGKSYTAKALTGRSALQGDEVLIVDPDDEYVRLTEALGGEVIRDPTQQPKEDSRVVCYALGETEEAGLHGAVGLALGSVWQRVDKGPVRRRQVVVDEAYLMLRENPEASYLLWALIKRSRKRLCGLTIITQDLADVLSTTLGESIINNASIHLLLRQTEKAIDGIGSAFGLSEGERNFLVAAPQGQGLLLVGGERAALKVVTSQLEHGLCVTDPAALLVAANR